jgi:hypothetical protein
MDEPGVIGLQSEDVLSQGTQSGHSLAVARVIRVVPGHHLTPLHMLQHHIGQLTPEVPARLIHRFP